MHHLAIVLLAAAAAALAPAPAAEQPTWQELCELGREIARQPPCLAGDENCESFRIWRRAMGDPELRLLPGSPSLMPTLAGRPIYRLGEDWRLEGPDIERLIAAHCPAASEAGADERQRR